jgi:integrase
VPQNAASKSDRPKVRPPEIHPLDAEQTKALLSTARGERLEALYVVAVTAGLRIGELLGLSWEDLDHTCATLLLSRGVHPKFVQELLGHSSLAMTLDRYSHWIPSMGDQTARAMEAALS